MRMKRYAVVRPLGGGRVHLVGFFDSEWEAELAQSDTLEWGGCCHVERVAEETDVYGTIVSRGALSEKKLRPAG